MASESTYRSDRGGKRDLYAGMGVSEYWQCDPVGDYLESSLLGFRLVEGRYVPIPVTTTEGDVLVGHSEVLGLELRLTPGVSVRDVLRFHDPMTGGLCGVFGKRSGGLMKRLRLVEKRSEVTKKRLRPVRKLRLVCGRLRIGSGNWSSNFRRCGSVDVSTTVVIRHQRPSSVDNDCI